MMNVAYKCIDIVSGHEWYKSGTLGFIYWQPNEPK